MISRMRRIIIGSGLLWSGLGSLSTFAQNKFPSGMVTIIVPFPPGNVSDVFARQIGSRLSVKWNVPVVVENIVGASGTIGMVKALRAPADGATIVIGTTGSTILVPLIQEPHPFDTLTAFAPITYGAPLPMILMTHPSVPVRTYKEFIEYAKKNPGKLSYGSLGIGSTPHLGMEILKDLTGINMVHIPYKGSAQASTDFLSGRVQVMLDTVPPSLSRIRSGSVNALAVTGNARIPSAPDIPSLAEVGFTQADISAWNGFFVPKNVPEFIQEQLNKDIRAILDDPETQQAMEKIGIQPRGGSRQDFNFYIKNEYDKWGDAIKKFK